MHSAVERTAAAMSISFLSQKAKKGCDCPSAEVAARFQTRGAVKTDARARHCHVSVKWFGASFLAKSMLKLFLTRPALRKKYDLLQQSFRES